MKSLISAKSPGPGGDLTPVILSEDIVGNNIGAGIGLDDKAAAADIEGMYPNMGKILVRNITTSDNLPTWYG